MTRRTANREMGEIKATLKYIQDAVNRLEDKVDEVQEEIRKARELALINSNEINMMKRNQQVELAKWAIGIGSATTILATILAWVLGRLL